jgi:hypothetical protein
MNLNNNFINPQPSMAIIMASTDDVTEALGKWGPVGNRGSHQDYVVLQLKSKTLHMRLTQLGAWCMSSLDVGLSYADQAAILVTSGFPLKNPGAHVGKLEMVQGFHRVFAGNLNEWDIKLKWSKPLGVATITNVKSYIIYRNTTNSFSTSSVIAAVPNTTYIDVPGTGSWFYWVVPVNNMGNGVPSQAVIAKIL